ncbi:hypothetical protein AAVH_42788 [Aphelenchoides avenae]|nr:hypothetical protein AAVH_42788 [Aphelenchus avenae]
MRDARQSLSTSTRRLYARLLNLLLIELTFVSVGILPMTVIVVALYTHAQWGSTAMVVAYSMTGLYTLESHLLWLFYLPPYRRALLRLFGRSLQTPGNFKRVSPAKFSRNTY